MIGLDILGRLWYNLGTITSPQPHRDSARERYPLHLTGACDRDLKVQRFFVEGEP